MTDLVVRIDHLESRVRELETENERLQEAAQAVPALLAACKATLHWLTSDAVCDHEYEHALMVEEQLRAAIAKAPRDALKEAA